MTDVTATTPEHGQASHPVTATSGRHLMTRVLTAVLISAALGASAAVATVYTHTTTSAAADPVIDEFLTTSTAPASDTDPNNPTVTALDDHKGPHGPHHPDRHDRHDRHHTRHGSRHRPGGPQHQKTPPHAGLYPTPVGQTRAELTTRHDAQRHRDLANNRLTPDGPHRAIPTPTDTAPARSHPGSISTPATPTPAVGIGVPAASAPAGTTAPPVTAPGASPTPPTAPHPGTPVAVPPTHPAAPSSQPATALADRPTGIRLGYMPYLRTATTTELALIAGPGIAALLGLTALGTLIGYRQAKTSHAITPRLARYLPPPHRP